MLKAILSVQQEFVWSLSLVPRREILKPLEFLKWWEYLCNSYRVPEATLEFMLIRLFSTEYAWKTNHLRELGLWPGDISPTSREERGPGDWVQSCDWWFNHPCLLQETTIKTLDIEALLSFLIGTHTPMWQKSTLLSSEDMKALSLGLAQILPKSSLLLAHPDLYSL